MTTGRACGWAMAVACCAAWAGCDAGNGGGGGPGTDTGVPIDGSLGTGHDGGSGAVLVYRSRYEPAPTRSATIRHDFGGAWVEEPMSRIANDEFSWTLPRTLAPGDYHLNILATGDATGFTSWDPSMTEWVAGDFGVRAASLTLGSTRLDDRFLVPGHEAPATSDNRDPNADLGIRWDGTSFAPIPGTPVAVDTRIPPDAPGGYHAELIEIPGPPPSSAQRATAWMQVIFDDRVEPHAMFDIDFLRIWARVGTTDVLVAHNEFDDGQIHGNVCQRFSWFLTEDLPPIPLPSFPPAFPSKAARFPIDTLPNRILQPWIEPDGEVPAGTDRLWAEARVLLGGGAMAGLGIDMYPQDVGLAHMELGVSGWYTESAAWQVITLNKP